MGLSKGGVPMIALLSVPLMSLFMDPALAAGLLLPIYIVADMYAVYLFRGAFSVRNLKVLLPAAIVGILIGFAAVSYVPGDAGKLLVAAIGLFYLITALRRRFFTIQATSAVAGIPAIQAALLIRTFTSAAVPALFSRHTHPPV